MASIWMQGPGCEAKKLEGGLVAQPDIVRARLLKWAAKLAAQNNAVMALDESFEIELQWKDSGQRFRVWAEFMSPPSREERGQPKRKVSQQ